MVKFVKDTMKQFNFFMLCLDVFAFLWFYNDFI